MDDKNVPIVPDDVNVPVSPPDQTDVPNTAQPVTQPPEPLQPTPPQPSAPQPTPIVGKPEAGGGAFETYVPEKPANQEASPEKLAPQETIKKSPEPEEKTKKANVQKKPVKPVKNADDLNIVDKTDKLTTLHPIQKSTSKLTQQADEDEEEFIKKVEAAHGHK